MARRIRAAVCSRPGGGLTVEELELADPGPDEVLTRIDAAGVCHSDYHYLTGDSLGITGQPWGLKLSGAASIEFVCWLG